MGNIIKIHSLSLLNFHDKTDLIQYKKNKDKFKHNIFPRHILLRLLHSQKTTLKIQKKIKNECYKNKSEKVVIQFVENPV